MAYQVPGYKLTAHAADSDLSNSQYLFVEISGENLVDVASDTSEIAIGVLQNDPNEGEEAEIMVSGVSKVYTSDDNISAGDPVTWNDDGEAEATSSTDEEYVVGIALADGVDEDVLIPVIMYHMGVHETTD